MSADQAIVLGLLLAAVILFIREWISVDLVTLLLLSALILCGILTPAAAFAGFASDIIVILSSIFVLSGALIRTGIMDRAGDGLLALAGRSRTGILLTVMLASSFVSSFMNNTTATAVFIPPVIGLARRRGFNPGLFLMPLAFGSILGGTCTLIGTSTNMAASGFIQRHGLVPFSMFEFLPVGLVMIGAGVGFMLLAGQKLLPPFIESDYTSEYEIRQYLTEILIPQRSSLVGKSITDTLLGRLDLIVLEIIRGEHRLFPEASTELRAGDLLIVQANRETLLTLKESSGIRIKADKLEDRDLVTADIKIVEAMVMPHSVLVGRSLKDLNFRRRYGCTALAIYRKGHALATKIGTLPLQVGDVLLLEGPAGQISSIQRNPDLHILEQLDHVAFRKRKGLFALIVLLLCVAAGASALVPLSVALLLGAVAVILTKCITAEEAYTFIEWRLLILIGGMTSFGLAMEQTGTAELLGRGIASLAAGYHPLVALGAFGLLTILLTQPMSNAAAALVVLPVALRTATELGASPLSFAVMVTLSASLSFIAPLEPSTLLVYGPGKYRFRDFVIVGFPLTLIVFAVLMTMVPLIWPL